MSHKISQEEKAAVRMHWLSLPVEERKKRWEELEATVPHNYEPYPIKRKKLAKAIHEIEDLMTRRVWTHWKSWKDWDFMRQPITFCFTCLYPVRLIPTLDVMSGKLKMLKCEHCELIHYDAKYD